MKRVRPRGWRDDLMIRFRGVRFHGAISAGWSPQRDLAVRSLWRDLAARSRQRELNGASGLVAVVWAQRREPDLTLSSLSSCSLSLSLSLSLSARLSSEIICSENRSVKYFSSQSHKTHGQLKLISKKFYFSYAIKHVMRSKIIPWNGFMQSFGLISNHKQKPN